MSGNGRGTMRPQGRTPPFLLIGLVVVLCILGFSHWNVSSTSNERAVVITRLQEELQSLSSRKLEADKRSSETNTKLDEIIKMKASLETKLQTAEKEAENDRIQVDAKNDELKSIGNELENKKEALRKCDEDSNGIQQELQKLKEETGSLKQEIANKPVQCDTNACEETIKNLLNILMNSLGRPQVIASLQNNAEFKKFLPDDAGNQAAVGQKTEDNPQVIVNPDNPQQPILNPDKQQQPPFDQNNQPQAAGNQDNQAQAAGYQGNQAPAAGPADQGAVGQVQPPQDLQKGQQNVDTVVEQKSASVVNVTGNYSKVEGNTEEAGNKTEHQDNVDKEDGKKEEIEGKEDGGENKKEEEKDDKKTNQTSTTTGSPMKQEADGEEKQQVGSNSELNGAQVGPLVVKNNPPSYQAHQEPFALQNPNHDTDRFQTDGQESVNQDFDNRRIDINHGIAGNNNLNNDLNSQPKMNDPNNEFKLSDQNNELKMNDQTKQVNELEGGQVDETNLKHDNQNRLLTGNENVLPEADGRSEQVEVKPLQREDYDADMYESETNDHNKDNTKVEDNDVEDNPDIENVDNDRIRENEDGKPVLPHLMNDNMDHPNDPFDKASVNGGVPVIDDEQSADPINSPDHVEEGEDGDNEGEDKEEKDLKFDPRLPPGDIQKENDAIDRMNENMAMDDQKVPRVP